MIIFPPPPLGRKALLGKVAKAHHGVEGGADEEDHDGVEEDVAIEGDHPDVEEEDQAGQGGGGQAARELPHGQEGEGNDGTAKQGATEKIIY